VFCLKTRPCFQTFDSVEKILDQQKSTSDLAGIAESGTTFAWYYRGIARRCSATKSSTHPGRRTALQRPFVALTKLKEDQDHEETETSEQLVGDIILDSIADGVFTVDGDRSITSFNRVAEEITGNSRDRAIGRKCFDVFQE